MSFVLKDKKLFISTIILIVFHVVGIIGLKSSYYSSFIQISSFTLLVSFILLLINHKQYNNSFYLFLIVSYIINYSVELFGVKTGILFGNYSYGNSLGIKLFDVPLIIGINWFILVYSVGCICHTINVHFIFKSIIGALMLVLLDILIEPVAIQLDFWTWEQNVIPIRNYVGWFITAFVLLILFNKFEFNKNNPLAKALYIIQLVFFALLGIL